MSSPADTVVVAPQCRGTTKAGAPCRSQFVGASGYCLTHDPEKTAEARAIRQAGGRATSKAQRALEASQPKNVPKEPKTLEDAARISAWITRATLMRHIDARTSEAATKAVRQFQLAEEKRVLVTTIKELRAELAEAKRRLGANDARRRIA